MNDHRYLRAYMAGILLPSWLLLVVLAAWTAGHYAGQTPPGLEGAILFPMAIVPNLWGLWNVLYARLGLRGRISLGAFGALLPLILVPAGLALASASGMVFYTARHAATLLPVVMVIYYLAWKYVVAFLNRVVGLQAGRLLQDRRM